MNADTTKQPDTIGLIRGLWVTRSASSGGSSASRTTASFGTGPPHTASYT